MAKYKNSESRNTLIAGMLLSFTMAFMLGIFAPLDTYFYNSQDEAFWFDFYTLFPICLLMFLGIFVVLAFLVIIVCFLHEKIQEGFIFLFICVFLITYIQGNYLAGQLPVMDGSPVIWREYDYQRISCIVLWIAVFATLFILRLKYGNSITKKIAKLFAIVIFLILSFSLVYEAVSFDGLKKKEREFAITSKDMFVFSKDLNFIIILTDAMDGRCINGIIDDSPEYRDAFKDFTYYSNTSASYPFTYFALPFLLSGDYYECDRYIWDYKLEVFTMSPLFEYLDKENYKKDMYTPDIPNEEEFNHFDNFAPYEFEIADIWDFIKIEMRYTGLKYAPYDLKRRCQVLPKELPMQKKAKSEYDEYLDVSNLFISNGDFHRLITESESEYTEEKVFKFIHTEGAHPDFSYDEYFNPADGRTLTYVDAAKASLNSVLDYIDRLKEAGVYDNSIVIVTSDHGFNTTTEDAMLGAVIDDDWGRSHSILFIKGLNDTGESLKITDAPIAQEDYPEAYFKLLEGAKGNEVFDYKSGDVRKRRFLFHYSNDRNELTEYEITGHVDDMESYIKTGRVYRWPDGLVEE
ncbi:MAG: sulfatase-like hydrolase/transferase [Lachnospiraceae bacterium]|nr:sulfatase-like hydrolase/transferase [Lachnospiraceae bacterium]